MKRYLITGGAGFIGGAIVQRLVALGHAVEVLDSPSKIARIQTLPGVVYHAGDIRTPEVFSLLQGPYEAVLHLAAQTSARVSHEDPVRDIDTNIRGTVLLLEWCRRQEINRFLFASSMQVYGNVKPDQLPFVEDGPIAPASYYGVSKIAVEHALHLHNSYGMKSTVFRMFNVYGPGQDISNTKQGIVGIFLAKALRHEPIEVTGSLDRIRDLVYIDDVVGAWMAALENPRSAGRTYNMGTGVRTSIRELINIILREAGHDPNTYPVREVAGHPGDQFAVQADITRIRNELGWSPRVHVQEGLKRMIAWARQTYSSGASL